MSAYRVRVTMPTTTEWVEIDASCPEEAANEFHCTNLESLPGLTFHDDRDDRRESVVFARIEVEGHDSFVSRCYRRSIRIRRRGGVKRRQPPVLDRLRAIATALVYDASPMTLLDPWEHESQEWQRT